MSPGLAKEIRTAIIITIAASILGLLVNTIRTPVLSAMEKSGKIHITQYDDYRGVNLIDDWSNDGRDVTSAADEPDISNGENGPSFGDTPSPPVAEIRRIQFPDAEMYFEAGEAVFLDARSIEAYKEGRISGALPWPSDEFLDYLAEYADQFSLEDHLIVYCDGGNCEYSEDLAYDLVLSGYLKIDIYLGGYEEWLGMGYPVESGEGGP